MRIDQVKAQVSVTIVAQLGKNVIELSSKVAKVYASCVYIEPIKQDDKMLGFGGKGLKVSMIIANPKEGKAYRFSNIKIRNVKTSEGELFHEVTCPTEAKLVNRRGACRVWLGEAGTVSVGLAGKPINVVVKDISVSGIAFICDKDADVHNDDIVRVSFTDSTANTKFTLGAVIVRSEELARSQKLYGCKLKQESNTITKFVNEKQREKLKASRQIANKQLATG